MKRQATENRRRAPPPQPPPAPSPQTVLTSIPAPSPKVGECGYMNFIEMKKNSYNEINHYTFIVIIATLFHIVIIM